MPDVLVADQLEMVYGEWDTSTRALKDVSFTVEPGTVLGVIGANGAGKTTLLKILARVITPTEGRVLGSGRVVSLLELGAGFDPELTARENIFLNAAMLLTIASRLARRRPLEFVLPTGAELRRLRDGLARRGIGRPPRDASERDFDGREVRRFRDLDLGHR